MSVNRDAGTTLHIYVHCDYYGDECKKGVLKNDGNLINNGAIELHHAINWDTDWLILSYFTNTGTFTNNGMFTNMGWFRNYGNFTNNGTLVTYYDGWVSNYGNLTNYSTLNISIQLHSYGGLANHDDAIMDNYGTISNDSHASYNDGAIYNYCYGIITGYRIDGNPVIEVDDCPTTPTPISTPPPAEIGCDSSSFPKYGLALVTNQQAGYDAPNGEPARDSAGNTLWLLRDADGDGDDTYVIVEIAKSGDTIWLGLYMGGCDVIYVLLDQVAPMNWLPLP